MNVSVERLRDLSAETGFRTGGLEKVIRLGELVLNISRHPWLGGAGRAPAPPSRTPVEGSERARARGRRSAAQEVTVALRLVRSPSPRTWSELPALSAHRSSVRRQTALRPGAPLALPGRDASHAAPRRTLHQPIPLVQARCRDRATHLGRNSSARSCLSRLGLDVPQVLLP